MAKATRWPPRSATSTTTVHPDLFVAGVRRNILYRNRGDGTFEDVTATAGITSHEWSIGAAWLDYDNDGLIDLFVVNYVEWTRRFRPLLRRPRPRYPSVLPSAGVRGDDQPPVPESRAAAVSADVSGESGIAGHVGKGMAVSVADYDGDGYPDISSRTTRSRISCSTTCATAGSRRSRLRPAQPSPISALRCPPWERTSGTSIMMAGRTSR